MFLELFVAAAALACGQALFSQFEERTPPWRRLLKVAFLLGGTAVLSWTLGRAWALGFVAALFAAGITVHIWFTRKHGIDPFTAEPREKYYHLRGWNWPT